MTDAEKITALTEALEACVDCMLEGRMDELTEEEEKAIDLANIALQADTDRSASDYAG